LQKLIEEILLSSWFRFSNKSFKKTALFQDFEPFVLPKQNQNAICNPIN
jgi:hypothetical protein